MNKKDLQKRSNVRSVTIEEYRHVRGISFAKQVRPVLQSPVDPTIGRAPGWESENMYLIWQMLGRVRKSTKKQKSVSEYKEQIPQEDDSRNRLLQEERQRNLQREYELEQKYQTELDRQEQAKLQQQHLLKSQLEGETQRLAQERKAMEDYVNRQEQDWQAKLEELMKQLEKEAQERARLEAENRQLRAQLRARGEDAQRDTRRMGEMEGMIAKLEGEVQQREAEIGRLKKEWENEKAKGREMQERVSLGILSETETTEKLKEKEEELAKIIELNTRMADDFDKTQEELEHTQLELAKATKHGEDLLELLESEKKKVDKLRLKWEESLEQVKSKEAELDELEREKQKTERDLENKESELMMLKRDLDNTIVNLENSSQDRKQLDMLRAELEKMQSKNSQLEENLLVERRDRDDLLQKSSKEGGKMNQEISRLKSEMKREQSRHSAEVDKLKGLLTEREDDQSRLKERVAKDQEELRKLKGILEGVQLEMGSFQDACSEQNALVASLRRANQQLTEKNKELEKEVDKGAKDKQRLEGSVSYKEKELKSAKQSKNKLKEQISKMLIEKVLLAVEMKRLNFENKDRRSKENILKIQLESKEQEVKQMRHKKPDETGRQSPKKKLKEADKSQSNPEMLKKIDKLNECMQQLEERIISKLKDISYIDSKHNSSQQAGSIRETSPFISQKMNKKFSLIQDNQSKLSYRTSAHNKRLSDHRQCKCPNYLGKEDDTVLNWVKGCPQYVLAQNSVRCVHCHGPKSRLLTHMTPTNGPCLRCKCFGGRTD